MATLFTPLVSEAREKAPRAVLKSPEIAAALRDPSPTLTLFVRAELAPIPMSTPLTLVSVAKVD